MDVKEAVDKRISVRAFLKEAPSYEVVRDLVERALRAPSGGNLQPWRIHVLAGEPLEGLKVKALAAAVSGLEAPEYDVYPENLWEPFRTRRYVCGEDLYATIGIGREDRPGRLRQLAQNANFFGAPVGLFFSLDRALGLPQWADLGIMVQTVMLLAVEAGLDTCAQEFWARLPKTVAQALSLPPTQMVFCGMALGYRDAAHPINGLRTRREPLEEAATFLGF